MSRHSAPNHRIESEHDLGILSVAITSAGSHAFSASVDETMRVWDLTNGQMVRRSASPRAFKGEVTLSPDGRTLLAGIRGRITSV